jgi:tRNA threonylcarbamoyl adenosine modification protein YeaZ
VTRARKTMRVLAIDTALEACSAAVLDSGRGGITASETVAMTRGHAEAVMPLIARVMDLADVEFAELDRIAVTTGPGSFTGLRVGISAARGIALAAGKPAIGLSTWRARGTADRGGRQHTRRGSHRRAARSCLSSDLRHRRAHPRRPAHRHIARRLARGNHGTFARHRLWREPAGEGVAERHRAAASGRSP